MTPSIFIVSLVFIGISMLVSMILKRKFAAYGKIPLAARLTGKEVAEKMLRENGIYDVKVVSVEGFLSDHYNPVNKTINLSPEVYNNYSISAAAVAALISSWPLLLLLLLMSIVRAVRSIARLRLTIS